MDGSVNESSTRRWSTAALRRPFITPELVSGSVLVCVVIAVADETGGILDVFAITLFSVLVFWATEVFAYTIAAQRRRLDTEAVQISVSVRSALREAEGFLLAGILPLVFLLLGLLGVQEGEAAYWRALWIEVGLLGLVGWIAFGGTRIAWYWRVSAAGATAALGLLAVLLKILVH